MLALSRSVRPAELVEDELLMALPLVPRHEVCPEPLPRRPTSDSTRPPAAGDNPSPCCGAQARAELSLARQ